MIVDRFDRGWINGHIRVWMGGYQCGLPTRIGWLRFKFWLMYFFNRKVCTVHYIYWRCRRYCRRLWNTLCVCLCANGPMLLQARPILHTCVLNVQEFARYHMVEQAQGNCKTFFFCLKLPHPRSIPTTIATCFLVMHSMSGHTHMYIHLSATSTLNSCHPEHLHGWHAASNHS